MGIFPKEEEEVRKILSEMIYWDEQGYDGTQPAIKDGTRRIMNIIKNFMEFTKTKGE